jgi:hypothetical protein
MSGLVGSRVTLSKSITASNSPLVRTQALTAPRLASPAAEYYAALLNGVSVPPKIFVLLRWTWLTICW